MSLKRFLGFSIVVGAVIGAVYLSTVGCCHLMGWGKGPVSLTTQLGLSGPQKQEVAKLEQVFLARKQASCDILCTKRAQLIQLLQQEKPDRDILARLVDEIGAEQAVLERATMDHLLAVRDRLDPAQRKKLAQGVTEQLRMACRATACGTTAGCLVKEGSESGERRQE